jgi:hypothetical protein
LSTEHELGRFDFRLYSGEPEAEIGGGIHRGLVFFWLAAAGFSALLCSTNRFGEPECQGVTKKVKKSSGFGSLRL